MTSDGFTKGGPGARKVRGGHHLIFQGKVIFKKSHCHRGSHF